jgi:hypothetical protein
MLRSTRYISAHFKRSLLVGGVVAAAALGTFALVAPDSGAATRPMALPGSVTPRVPAGSVKLGTMAAAQKVSVEVTLNLRNQAQLDALLNGQADPSSPYYGHYLSAAQFDAAFGPTADQVTQVGNALRASGLNPGQPSADRLSIPVTGTAAQIQHAFGTTLATYRLKGGRVAYANTSVPQVQTGVAPLIQGVLGLDNFSQPRSMMSPRAKNSHAARAFQAAIAAHPFATVAASAAPTACAAAKSAWPLTFSGTFAPFYGLTSLYGLGDYGAGAKVAIMELEPNSHADVSSFQSCYGSTATVNYVAVDGGAGSGAGSGEAALDIEVVAALAPHATIDVYQAPNADPNHPNSFFDAFNKFATANTEKTMSVSWGGCEANIPAATMMSFETVFKKSAAQGQTIVASSGDSGSTGCFIDGGGSDRRLSANFPASSPYVTAVGGTEMATFTDGTKGEVVWNESAAFEGASGGAISNVFCMPDYQYQTAIPGLINPNLKVASGCKTAKDPTGYHREIPDVSANADPETGYGIFWNGQWIGGVGGTSASAPLWAAIAALTDVSPYCRDYGSGSAGVQPAALYAAASRAHAFIYGTTVNALYDVLPVTPIVINGTSVQVPRSNDYLPSGYKGFLYPVATGDDITTGLGTPRLKGAGGSTYTPGYTELICQQLKTRQLAVTGVTPASGKANAATAVTIKGTGFLSTAGAMRVRVYSGSTVLATLTPQCTITACTVTLPAESARTVDLRASAANGAYTNAVTADRFTYK